MGVWYLFLQTFNYLNLIDFGISTGIVRELSIENAKNNNSEIKDIIASGKLLLFIVGIVFSIVGICSIYYIPNLIFIPNFLLYDFKFALFLVSIWGIFRFFLYLPILSLQAFNKILQYNILSTFQDLIRLLLSAIFFLFKPCISSIALGYISSEIMIRMKGFRTGSFPTSKGKLNINKIKNIFFFGSLTGFISVSTLLLFYTSSLIIGWRIGLTEIAIYQCSVSLSILLGRFAIIPFRNLLPKYYSLWGKGEYRFLVKNSREENIRILLITLIGLFFATLINKLFVKIWVGIEFYAGLKFTIAYNFFMLMSIARHNGYMAFLSISKIKLIFIFHLIEIPLNIVLSLILIDIFGLNGLPYAFIFATLPTTILSQSFFFRSRKRLNELPRRKQRGITKG